MKILWWADINFLRPAPSNSSNSPHSTRAHYSTRNVVGRLTNKTEMTVVVTKLIAEWLIGSGMCLVPFLFPIHLLVLLPDRFWSCCCHNSFGGTVWQLCLNVPFATHCRVISQPLLVHMHTLPHCPVLLPLTSGVRVEKLIEEKVYTVFAPLHQFQTTAHSLSLIFCGLWTTVEWVSVARTNFIGFRSGHDDDQC